MSIRDLISGLQNSYLYRRRIVVLGLLALGTSVILSLIVIGKKSQDRSTKRIMDNSKQRNCQLQRKTGFCIKGSACTDTHDPSIQYDPRFTASHITALSNRINSMSDTITKQATELCNLRTQVKDQQDLINNLVGSLKMIGFSVQPTGQVDAHQGLQKSIDAIKTLPKLSDRSRKD
ncbi:MAG: hypothetical protein QKV09_gp5 [Fushun ischnura senegalensis lispivirus 1]|uniref:C3H1-type domain-containing protein n=1 Tax=Fushun ischnura senegalensis lispivirus 1 TaxID=2905564 RepID=A0A8K1XGQ0_9MONO|nr:MAG: hypothetical protein QKV09_gp5 [Fushun ischnura senegalensis lispivirus 1]UHM27655.1 MAG: hypothetical protein FISLV1_gp5 [Fushun ischnura senegalensis lispivirus 1]